MNARPRLVAAAVLGLGWWLFHVHAHVAASVAFGAALVLALLGALAREIS